MDRVIRFPWRREAAAPRALSARLENADAIAAAARRADVPLALAAALTQLESGGRNVFGHDAGGVHSAPRGTVVPVTRERFEELVARVAAGETSNGVGPAQITWPPYFEQARRRGLRLWEPEDNLAFGLEILRGHLGGEATEEAIARAGTLYNAGTLKGGVTDYGRRLARATRDWAARLGEPAPPSSSASSSRRRRSAERAADAGLPGGAAASGASGATHVIAPGDTLWAIAREHSTDVATLRRLNPDLVPEALPVGGTVRLP